MHHLEVHLLWRSRSGESRHWHPPRAPLQLESCHSCHPPPCASGSLKSHQGDSCLPGSTSVLNRTDVSAGSSRSASPKLSKCRQKCLFVCDRIRSVRLTPVPFRVPSPRARAACAGCDICGALASAWQHRALQIMKGFFN